MGFNIAGIVINHNYDNKIEELGKKLNLNLSFKGDISYEEAVANWKDEGVCDIYFTEQGTLMFLPFSRLADTYSIEDQNILYFGYSESMMVFSLEYYENGVLRRNVVESDGEIMVENGEPLPEEESNSELSELIFDKIENILGKSFWAIDFEEKSYSYSF